jgi:sugar lactone lactonase YvrE
MSNKEEFRVAIDVRCELGEGPIWHPERASLLWFDIEGQVLYEADPNGNAIRAHGFGEAVSAAALIDASSIGVASASGFYRVDLDTGERSLLAPLEANNPATRSNDGRVGPGGAFWVGTMGRLIENGAGALYRFSDGEFTQLQSGLTCPNCLAFSPDGTRAYFSDTFDHRILVFPLDPDTGAPTAEPDLFLDLSDEGIYPDGAVVDVEGCLWNAQWGTGRVARYRPDGSFERAIELPVSQPTCPAFGGANHQTLFVTTAWTDLSDDERANQPLAGAVFSIDLDVAGLPEHRVAV